MECAVKLFLQYVQPSTASTIEKDAIEKDPILPDTSVLSPQANNSNKVVLSKALMSLSGFEHTPSLHRVSQQPYLYDKQVTTKGKARKRAPHQSIQDRPFSALNITARDFWTEYKYGQNQGLPLEQLETQYGSKWQSDSRYTRADGSTGTSLKSAWSLQKPISDYIEFLLANGKAEEEALDVVQEIFDQNSWKSGKPKLSVCIKLFRECMASP
jgi:hypothetical protein